MDLITVGITQFEYDKGERIFRYAEKDGLRCIPMPGEESELAAELRHHGASHVVLGVECYRSELYDVLPKGGVIARYGVGFDSLNLARASERGLLCVNTPGALEESVAEYTVALILAASRNIPALNAGVRKGEWKPHLGSELRGKRLAIIGCGQIGRSVARIASAGFGMVVIGSEVRYVDRELMKREYGFSDVVRDFATAVNGADFVSLHIPSTPATRHFINTRRLGLMSPGSWLINTSRGAVVDEVGLYDALVSGIICGCALDVCQSEPYSPVQPGKDLRSLDNVIITPHVASSTVEACDRVAERALSNILLAERKEYENMDLLNPEVLLNLEDE